MTDFHTPPEDPEEHPHMDAENENALMWIGEDGYLRVGDEEVAFKLSSEQAREWALSLWKYHEAVNKAESEGSR